MEQLVADLNLDDMEATSGLQSPKHRFVANLQDYLLPCHCQGEVPNWGSAWGFLSILIYKLDKFDYHALRLKQCNGNGKNVSTLQ